MLDFQEIFLSRADNPSTFSFRFRPLSPLLAFVTSPFFPALVSILVLSFFTHPSLNFMGNSRRINMQSFLKANPILSLHLSHLPPPLPLQTTSALYLHFIISSACLHLVFPSFHQTVPFVSQIPVYVPRHTCHSHSLCHCLSRAGAAPHSYTLWLSLGIDQFRVEMSAEKKDVMWG